jgi:hypothetical protein
MSLTPMRSVCRARNRRNARSSAGVVAGGVGLGAELRNELGGGRVPPRRGADGFEEVGVQGEGVGEELGRGEDGEGGVEPAGA